MDLEMVMTVAGWVTYGALALVAAWGWMCVFLVHRQVKRRRFPSEEAAAEFQQRLADCLADEDFDAVESLCSEPEYWYRATPHLIRGATKKRRMAISKLKQVLASRFEREILSTIDNGMASVNTVVKSAPMLGLLGTVLGMIGAFGKIAGVEHPNPGDLAGDINVALYTTAIGLSIAIPLVVASNYVSVRIRKLEDATAEQMQDFFDALEQTTATAPAPPSKPSRVRTG